MPFLKDKTRCLLEHFQTEAPRKFPNRVISVNTVNSFCPLTSGWMFFFTFSLRMKVFFTIYKWNDLTLLWNIIIWPYCGMIWPGMIWSWNEATGYHHKAFGSLRQKLQCTHSHWVCKWSRISARTHLFSLHYCSLYQTPCRKPCIAIIANSIQQLLSN